MIARLFRTDREEILDEVGITDRGRVILSDLDRWNRLSGWYRFHVRMVRRHWEAQGSPRPLRILDVGTGPGGLLAALADAFPDAELTGLDRSPAYVAMAQARVGARAKVITGDATKIDAADGAFHLATSTLMLHHLPPPVREAMLAELGRVARSVYLFDLELGMIPMLGWAGLATVLGMSADARHDGVLSVRRASTLGEMRALVRPLPVRVRRVFPGAMCTVPR